MVFLGISTPNARARLGGVFYLLMFLCGGVATLARRGLIVGGNAAATAQNIMAHQGMYVLSFAGEILVVATYIVVVALFYRMLKPVSKSVSVAAAFFGVMGCAVQGASALLQLSPLAILGGAKYLTAFNTAQLQALAYLFLRLYSYGYGVAIIFFACFCFSTGYLIFRSTFLPRFVGVLMMVAGVFWLSFLSPPFAAKYFPLIVCGAIGELVLTLWLVFKGVDTAKWDEQAAASAQLL